MTAPERQIYLLDPKTLSPETIAVTFAKTSRSPESFREIAAGLTDEKSAQFHERWVVGYGHASVAEHAVLHVAIENVSRLAVESIESNRLASYTEKSTRYQKWAPDAFYVPEMLQGTDLLEPYTATCRRLLETYLQILPQVQAEVERELPCAEGESDAAWGRRIRTEYIDACRFLLPASSLANLGFTANARVLEHAIRKLLSDSLPEARQIGGEICQVSQAEVPTLVKYADYSAYLDETRQALEMTAGAIPLQKSPADWCRLVDYDQDAEARVLAAALYRFGEMDFPNALQAIIQMTADERVKLASELLGRMGRFDIPLRELEYANFTFDLLVDQGGYFEIKRHRMMTQTPQRLTARLGYAVPRRVEAAGAGAPYRAAMDAAGEMYERLAAIDPHLGAYVVPNGYNRRVLLQMNLRSAFHFCRLRSASNAHFSVRRVAQRMASEINQVAPALAVFMGVNAEESWQGIQGQYFTQV
jgi:thymidylate synthase ThyX